MENTLLVIARLLAEGASPGEIAAHLHTSVEWVELVVGSDAFLLLMEGTGNE